MRLNQSQPISKLVKNFHIQKLNNDLPIQEKQHQPIFNKQELWILFLKEFKFMYGVNFIKSDENINNIKILFCYFLRDNEFFNCNNLISSLSNPTFKKGLLVLGGYGIGKTAYFKVFEKIFNDSRCLRFKRYGAKELVSKYEACITPFDKSYMMDKIARPRLFIDDINSERIASNYGSCDVIEEILFNQNENNHITYVTCNHTNSESSVDKTLCDLGIRYGGRLHDRFFEMFNIVEFKGRSLRR